MAASLQERLEALKDQSSGKDARAAQRLLDRNPSSYSDLQGLLLDDDARLAIISAWALGHVGGKRHAPSVLKVLKSDREELWTQAGVTLAQLSSKRSVQPLLDMLSDADAPTRRREAATYGIGFMSGFEGDTLSDATDRLCAVLADDSNSLRQRALAAEGLGNLHELGDRRRKAFKTATDALIEQLTSDHAELRFWSAFALGKMRASNAAEPLQALKEDDTKLPGWWTVAEEAQDALTVIDGGDPTH